MRSLSALPRARRARAALLCVTGLIAACGGGGGSSSTTAAGTSPAGASTTAIAGTRTSTPGSSTSTTPISPAIAAALANGDAGLGTLTFTTDAPRSVKGTTSTSDLVLEAADATGGRWTLTVPGAASAPGEAITMTPFATVRGDRPGWTSGVLLEPDGAYFAQPVTLAYARAAGTPERTLYVTDHQGGHVAVAVVDAQGRALLNHFSGGAAGDPANSSLLPPDDLTAAVAQFDEALRVAEAAETNRPLPGTTLTGNAFECADMYNYANRAREVAARYRDPWERDLGVVRSLYASLLAIAARYGGLAELDRDFDQRMSQLADAYAVGPSNQVRQAIESYDAEEGHLSTAFPVMEYVVPLVTVPGQGENASPVVDERNRAALRTWGLHIAHDLASRVFSEKRYSLVKAIIHMGQAGGDATGLDPDLADKLDVALQFDVKIDLALSSGSLGVPTNATAKLSATGLRLVRDTLIESSPLSIRFEGDGTITENGGVIATDKEATYSMATLSVPTKVKLTVDPCDQITIDAEPWGTNESITLTKKGKTVTMAYPGTGMWDSAMRTALMRTPDALKVKVNDDREKFSDSVALSYTEGDVSVAISADIEVTYSGKDPGASSGPA